MARKKKKTKNVRRKKKLAPVRRKNRMPKKAKKKVLKKKNILSTPKPPAAQPFRMISQPTKPITTYDVVLHNFDIAAAKLQLSDELKQLIKTPDPLVRFLKTNKEHRLAPNACFVLARGFNEKMNNSARAEKLLKAIIQNLPYHDLAIHAQRYLDEMSKKKVQTV